MPRKITVIEIKASKKGMEKLRRYVLKKYETLKREMLNQKELKR